MMEDASDIAYHMPFLEECASRAGIIVEIGVGHGNGSTRAFARGLARSTKEPKMHIGVDPDPERPQERPVLFTQVVGKSEDEITADTVSDIVRGYKIAWINGHPSIIFIDTIHTYEQMSMEMPLWFDLANKKTLFLYHDTWLWGVYNHMTNAIKEFAKDGWEYLDQSKLAHGMGVLRHREGPWGWITPREEEAPVAQV
jgi:hypothetical protein